MVAIGKLYGPAQWHPLAQGVRRSSIRSLCLISFGEQVIATANAAGLELESPPFEHFKDNHAVSTFSIYSKPSFQPAHDFTL